ncbi:LacI family DNA-binding transcriptional regulator [Humibacter soli]
MSETPHGEKAQRAPTLADVAAGAGVAVSTASRALSNPGRVNVVTRQRIERVASELGYSPNQQARALTSGRARAIAVLVSDVTNPFYFGIIRGTQQQLKASGYSQLLVDTEESDQNEDELLHRLRSSFDGVILAASRLSDRSLARLADELPLVAVNRQTRGVPSVFIDTPRGVVQALEHLVSLGHRDIAYVSGPETSWSNESRWRALVKAASARGATMHRLGPFAPRQHAGAAAADAVLNTGATAAIAFNDLLAIGMLQHLASRGIRVPERLSVVGCDDIFGADFCNPPLTTLTAPVEQAGRLAVTMLLTQLDNGDAPGMRQTTVLPTYLTVRSSTGPAAENVAADTAAGTTITQTTAAQADTTAAPKES